MTSPTSLLLLAALAIGTAVSCRPPATVAQTQTSVTAPEPVLPEIDGYQNWRKVNEARLKMADEVATLCVVTLKGLPPHGDKFIWVYGNELAQQELWKGVERTFPVGSVIVKEKYGAPEGGEPELLTVMIKRDPGYNPEVGDWEFATVAMEAKKAVERGKLKTCMSCHQRTPDTDHVFSVREATYAPEEQERSQPLSEPRR
jgi:hypothetical protein